MGITGLREDLNELIVGQEEETREGASLGVEVIFQFLSDVIQTLVVILKLLFQTTTVVLAHHNGVFVDLVHVLFPELIYLSEQASLILELLSDIVSTEDVLQVHPTALKGEPLLDNNVNILELHLPLFNFIADFSHKF